MLHIILVYIDYCCSVALRPQGSDYLTQLFYKFDVDKDGALSPSELANLFSVSYLFSVFNSLLGVSTLFISVEIAARHKIINQIVFQVCPNIPWDDFGTNVQTSEMGWLTMEGYEAIWALSTHLCPELTLECLGYLGYNCDTRGNQLTAVQGSMTHPGISLSSDLGD